MVDTSNLNTTPSAASQTRSSASLSRLTSDFGSFLNLLTTQLRNQDPLNPLETHEFTNQLVLFAGVEQSILANSHLEKIEASNRLGALTQAQQLVGKAIDYTKGALTFDSTGKLTIKLNAAEDVTTATLQIFDQDTQELVHQFPVVEGLKRGLNEVTWDGTVRDAAGVNIIRRYERGNFRVNVASAYKANGTPVADNAIRVLNDYAGVIRSIAYENQTLYAVLRDSGEKVPFENIINIAEPLGQDQNAWVGQISTASSLIGQPVRYKLATVPLTPQGADFQVSVPADAFAASVEIFDRTGRLVHRGGVTLPGGGTASERATATYTWDGNALQYDDQGNVVYVKGEDGQDTAVIARQKLTSGEFSFRVTNVRSFGTDGRSLRTVGDLEAFPILPERSGVVQAVDVVDGVVVLRIPGALVPLTAVSGVDARGAAASTPTPAPAASASALVRTPLTSTDQQLQSVYDSINREAELLQTAPAATKPAVPVASALDAAGAHVARPQAQAATHGLGGDSPSIDPTLLAAALAPAPTVRATRPWGQTSAAPEGRWSKALGLEDGGTSRGGLGQGGVPSLVNPSSLVAQANRPQPSDLSEALTGSLATALALAGKPDPTEG